MVPGGGPGLFVVPRHTESTYAATVSRSVFAELGTDDVEHLPGLHVVRGHYVPGAP